MDLKPCPFCGGKAKQVDICATDFSSANAGGSYIICQSCLACSAVMFGEKAGLSELWNCRALHPEPRTCETCQAKCPYPYAEPGCPFHVARSPQSADVERLREALTNIHDYGIDRDGETTAEKLGELVDELVKLAREALAATAPGKDDNEGVESPASP